MLIVCPTCATTYQIQLAALGTAGRSVRCASCKNTWFATAEAAVTVSVPEAYQDPAPPPDRFSAPASRRLEDMIPPDRSENPFTVADAPPLVPHDHPEPGDSPFAPSFDASGSDDTETIAARRSRQAYVDREDQRPLLQRLLSLPMLIVACLAILAGALQWRVPMVKFFPQTASLYSAIGLPVNLRGLIFEDVKSTSDVQDGVTVLAIEGMIVNLTRHTLEVPRLRLALRNGTGQEVYTWTALPPKTTLGSGNGLPFRVRLASPPPDGRDVIVRFFNRRDAVAGAP